MSIKPHLLYLFWIVLALWILHGKRMRKSTRSIWRSTITPTLPSRSTGPTLRNLVRILLAVESSRVLQFSPTAIAVIWGIWHWRRNRETWHWDEQFPLISAVSVASGFFVWTYDHVVLLPALWHAGVWIARCPVPWHRFRSVYIHVTINVLHGLLRFLLPEEFWYVWLARALPPGGRVITLEVNAGYAEIARANLVRAGLSDRVDIRLGRALDSLAALEAERGEPFDFIFIDADKPSYADYFRWAVRLSRPGTVIVADNVVRDGGVADPASPDPVLRQSTRLRCAAAFNTQTS